MTKKKNVQRMLIGYIKSGILNVGDKLSSLRELTMEMGISVSTALDAYNDLVSYGVLESRPKNGYFVLSDDGALLNRVMKQLALTEFPKHLAVDDSEQERIILKYTEDSMHPFSKTCVQLMSEAVNEQFFVNDAMAKLYMKASRNALPHAGSHSPAEKDSAISLAIAKWMTPLGTILQRKMIAITNNVSEALILAIRTCISDGGLIAVESPGDTNFYRAIRFLSMKYVEIRSDPDTGLCIDELESHILRGVKLSCLLVSVNHANPTGAVMPEENRRRLIDLCAAGGIPIIENDTLGRLSFSPTALRPLKTMDHSNVIFLSDLSKILGEDFNLGFIEAGKHADKLKFIKSISGITVPVATENSVAQFMSSTGFEIHIAQLRWRMKISVEQFYAVLRERCPPSLIVSKPRGGPYLWCELPEGKNMRELADVAAEYNLLLAPGRVFSSMENADRCFRVNCCTVWERENILGAAETLSEALIRYLSR
ncbi:MAG: PLP-dependent aminotransferase family protein [Oscillospiraceae bacterium]|nr:PLP-dependent aminotransferase family protein [Oscillospiraceae bacterium]